MTDILQAARSYYGLADTESCTTQLYTNQAGQTCVAFEIPLSNEDFAAIVQRMHNMQQPDTQPDTAVIEGPTVEAMREAYNALSKAEKGRYGSFARYMAESSTGIIDVCAGEPYKAPDDCTVTHWDGHAYQWNGDSNAQPSGVEDRQVVHIDAPEEPEPVSMDAVWLPDEEATDAQRRFASDWRNSRTGGTCDHLVQWAMLTDEQKQKAKEGGK